MAETTPTFVRGEDAVTALASGQKAPVDKGGVVPRFFIHRTAKEDGTLTEMECIELIIPGDLKSKPIHKVREYWINMFPNEYEAFKKGAGMEVDGTSFELWLGRDDPRIPDMRHRNITTVEQLADVSDTLIAGMGLGYRDLRDKARAYIAMRSSPESLAAQNEALMASMAKMQAQLDAMTNPDAGVKQEGPAPEKPDTGAATPVMAEGDGTPPYTIARGYQRHVVTDAEGKEVTDGKKAECEAWVAAHSAKAA